MDVVTDPGTQLHSSEIFRLLQKLQLAYTLAQTRYRNDLELNDTDMRALNLLRSAQTLSPGELGRCLGVSSAGTTTVLDRLEAHGYIRRQAHPADRRRTIICPGENFPEVGGPGITLMRAVHEFYGRLDEPTRRAASNLLWQTWQSLSDPAAGEPTPEEPSTATSTQPLQ